MFAQNLKQLRLENDLTQGALAQAIHVSRSAIAKWEQGRGFPTDESLNDLAQFFKVDKAQLLDDDQERVRRYRLHEKKKKILWISLSAFVVIALAGGITGGVLYQQSHQYAWNPTALSNTLQNRGFLCETGKTYSFSTQDVVPSDSSIQVSSLDLSNGTYGDGSYYRTGKTDITFQKPGYYTILSTVYDQVHHNAYSHALLGAFYVYDPAALTPISSLAELKAISAHPKGAYYLASNIDAKEQSGFSPLCLGKDEESFQGVFLNPLHYWISGLTLSPKLIASDATLYFTSLFGQVKNAYIDSLILKDFTAEGSGVESYTGAIASLISQSHLAHCHVEGNVKGRGLTGGFFAFERDCQLEDSSFSGTITSSATSTDNFEKDVGGIVGGLSDPYFGYGPYAAFEEVKVNATLTAEDKVGGIIGHLVSLDEKGPDDLLANSTFEGTIISSGKNQGAKCGRFDYGSWY
jgi:transcriptional regulator with XRE-family HTH domain